MDKNVEEMIENQKRDNETIKQMISSMDYIKWLVNFTKDKECFYDDNWDYSAEKLSDNDQKNVNNLSLFFKSIYCYAKKNYISSSLNSLGEYYCIKIGNNGFEIGYITGQGTAFYCKKILLDKNENFIDFIDIINNKKQDNVEYIESSIENLSSMIINLYNNGVPIEAIDKAINNAIKSIVNDNNEDNINQENKFLKKKLY